MTGQTINNYLIERKLGEGGMGDVYFARHNRIDRAVAIKVLHQNLFANESIRNRFKNEANALIKLTHANIVKIYDYVEQDSLACLIIEYIDGYTLDDYILKVSGPLSARKATYIICEVLEAVQYAHDHNVYHRDIKPGNIMLSRDGKRVKIMDFGIAKFTDASKMKTTHANAQLGTPFYMSPEQVKGLPYTLKSDIYSLGVTLFEMVTGKCPYIEITNLFELQSKIVNEPLPPTSKYYPNVSLKIQNAIKIATNKVAEQRFKNCNEFKDYLLEDEKVSAAPLLKQTQLEQPKPQQPKPQAPGPQNSKPQEFVEEKKKNDWGVYLLFFLAIFILGFITYFTLKETSPPIKNGGKTGTVETTQVAQPKPPVRNIPKEADSLISQREALTTIIIADPLKRNQLKEKLIDAITNNPSIINSILDSAFRIPEPIVPPKPPTSDMIINDLIDKTLSDGSVFYENDTRNIKGRPTFYKAGNYAILTFRKVNSDSLYQVKLFYTKNKTGYAYSKNITTITRINVHPPQDPSPNPRLDNPCSGAPLPPTEQEVKQAFETHLLQGGYKAFGVDYLEIPQIYQVVKVGKAQPSTNCFNLTFIINFPYKGKNLSCTIKFTQKGNSYKPVTYIKL